MIQTGQHGRFYWLVASRSLPSIAEIVVQCHPTLRLCITAFDSGPITPSADELALGWTTHGKGMVSPPLGDCLHIPHDGYDEWYLLEEPPASDWEPDIFVNYGGFTLVSMEEILKSYDPTWDRHGLDWLVPIQERFWEQMERINPVSYVAMGDNDVVVSQRRELIERLRAKV
jgi:hypothetical protein